MDMCISMVGRGSLVSMLPIPSALFGGMGRSSHVERRSDHDFDPTINTVFGCFSTSCSVEIDCNIASANTAANYPGGTSGFA